LTGIGKRQRPEQNALHDGEDCRRRPYTEGQHEHCGRGEAWGLAELSKREFEIGKKPLHSHPDTA
jgi:hypothetical protein